MKTALILLLLGMAGGCVAQTGTNDTIASIEKWKGEIITSETRLGHIHYTRMSEAVEVDIYLIKYTDLNTGYIDKGISLNGTVTSDAINTLGGVIWEKDLDKFIRSFRYICDSLLAKKPAEKTIYSNNTLGPDVVLKAEFNPYDKKKWVVSLCFGTTPDTWVTVDGSDCKNLEALLIEGRRRLKDL